MRLTVSYNNASKVLSTDVPESMNLEDFKAYLHAEVGIAPEKQVLQLNGKDLNHHSSTLVDAGLSDDCLLVLTESGNNSLSNGGAVSQANAANSVDQIESMRRQFLENTQMKEQLRRTNQALFSQLDSPEGFRNLILNTFNNNHFTETSSQREKMRKLEENPEDPANQAEILKMIRERQIEENMQLAYDISPESFTSVNMLYIKMKVNGNAVQAFVDSGAQTTLISPRLAEKCGISRLIDRRFIGEARGVGSRKIEGRIHSVPISIGDSNIELPCTFTVLDTEIDLLFGLDMLRRHRCIIDLEQSLLIVGGNIRTPFLQESEMLGPDIFSRSSQKTTNIFGGQGHTLGSKDGGVSSTSRLLGISTDKNNSNVVSQKSQAEISSDVPSSKEKFSEEKIQHLVGLGFSREEAVFALEQCNGNLEFAASLLFQ